MLINALYHSAVVSGLALATCTPPKLYYITRDMGMVVTLALFNALVFSISNCLI